jgi:hypothetical protein
VSVLSFSDCIQAALSTGAIDRYEADDLSRRWAALEEAERTGQEPKGFARKALQDQLDRQAAEAERVKLLQVKAADAARRDIHRFALEQRPDVGAAIMRMFENFGFTGYSSVRNSMQALIGAAHSEMDAAIAAFGRSGLTLRRRGLALLDETVRAAFGGSNDPGAQALAKAIAGAQEKLRLLFNEAGGNIGWLERYGLPMYHDGSALMKSGFDKWRSFIEPRLNWDEMKHAVSGGKIYDRERADVLRHVWESIVTEGWNTRDPAAPGYRAKYAQRQDARFLIFKDADAWHDYNRSYGTGDAWETVNRHIRGMARDIAMMRRFGPNPTRTIDWLKNVVMQEATNAKIGKPSLFARDFEAFGKGGDHAASARRQIETIDGLHSLARGDTGVTDGALADTFAAWRNVQYSAKLGGAIAMHATTNPIVQEMARRLHGLDATSQFMDMARGLANEHEATRAGLLAQDALHVLEAGAREGQATQRLRNLTAWLPKATAHYSGLEPFVAAQRRAFAFGAMAHFGDQLAKNWSELSDANRRLLAGYGIRKDEWAAIRLAEPYAPGGGAPLLRFKEIAEAGQKRADEVAALGLSLERPIGGAAFNNNQMKSGLQASVTKELAADYMRDVAYKYLEMLHGGIEEAVPSSSWRMRAALVGNSREGTAWGEARRSFAMFKGFMGSFMLTRMEYLRQQLARDGLAGTAAQAGAWTIALTLGGLAALQIKTAASGKDMRAIDPASKEGRDTWGQAALISGGLGIFGDFLASDRSAYGHGPLETAAGPMVTGAIDAYAALRNIGEGKKTLPQKLAAGAVDVARNNTPIASTHLALRLAYNRIFLDQLEFLANPDAHARMRRAEERLARETRQGFWWRPGETHPRRLPEMAR